MPLHPRVAIVTGGGRGIGRAMALALAEERRAGDRFGGAGARRNRGVAAEAEQRFGERRIVSLIADVTRDDDCERLVEAAFERFGRLDVLVNNAGAGCDTVSETF